jgi:predicted alpha/beta-hydrolase family hydrolase
VEHYYLAEGLTRALFVLAHGAGAGQSHPFMLAVADGLASRGIAVVTFDFPYMRERRHMPDKAPVLEQAFREAIVNARRWNAEAPLFIGGKSMGGRMATHLAAQGMDELRGTVALGYPLHPPGKPDQLRVAHLPSIATPLLIVQGERDTFGTPAELEPVLKTITAPVQLHVVAGGDHSLTVRGKGKAEAFEDVLDVVAGWMLSGLSQYLPQG